MPGLLMRVKTTLSLGGKLVEPGVYPAEDLKGADFRHLIDQGAAEPHGGRAWQTLLPDDPTKEELVAEIARLQEVLESQAAEIEQLHRRPVPKAATPPGWQADPEGGLRPQPVDPDVGRPPVARATGFAGSGQAPPPPATRGLIGGRGDESVVGFPNPPPAAGPASPEPPPAGDRPKTVEPPGVEGVKTQGGAERRTR